MVLDGVGISLCCSCRFFSLPLSLSPLSLCPLLLLVRRFSCVCILTKEAKKEKGIAAFQLQQNGTYLRGASVRKRANKKWMSIFSHTCGCATGLVSSFSFCLRDGGVPQIFFLLLSLCFSVRVWLSACWSVEVEYRLSGRPTGGGNRFPETLFSFGTAHDAHSPSRDFRAPEIVVRRVGLNRRQGGALGSLGGKRQRPRVAPPDLRREGG
ncbi:hypothetical protein TcG_08659 [Trypanosoma cruzi]|nr:hypothetical protein TcG_08659 [Trypanosoma cruzi]